MWGIEADDMQATKRYMESGLRVMLTGGWLCKLRDVAGNALRPRQEI
jgi:hypothetical protein